MTARIRIEPWGAADLALLQQCLGDPVMMQHLGGPESPEQIAERQARYEEPGSRQFKIVDEAGNAPSNAVCRKLGFTLLGARNLEYPKGSAMRCNDWRLDLYANVITPRPGAPERRSS